MAGAVLIHSCPSSLLCVVWGTSAPLLSSALGEGLGLHSLVQDATAFLFFCFQGLLSLDWLEGSRLEELLLGPRTMGKTDSPFYLGLP